MLLSMFIGWGGNARSRIWQEITRQPNLPLFKIFEILFLTAEAEMNEQSRNGFFLKSDRRQDLSEDIVQVINGSFVKRFEALLLASP